jgi:hypothetical protein
MRFPATAPACAGWAIARGLKIAAIPAAQEGRRDMQHVIGVVLVVLGGLSGVLALLLTVAALQASRAARAPRRVLASIPGHAYYEVAGTIVNTPNLQAPFTLRPCVCWRLTLAKKDTSGDSTTWATVWSQSRMSDIRLMYDWVKSSAAPAAPVSGVLTFSADLIDASQLPAVRGQTQTIALTPVNLAHLASADLPDTLRDQVAAHPKSYRLVERYLTSGDFLRGYQLESAPNPHAKFTIIALTTPHGLSRGILGLTTARVSGFPFAPVLHHHVVARSHLRKRRFPQALRYAGSIA